MVVVTFRNRFNPGIDEQEYGQRVAKLYEIVAAMPGFRAPTRPRTASACR
jgi:hypothetical protein